MDTIFALSSGTLPSGVAVVRISGTSSRFALETLCGGLPGERMAALRPVKSANGAVLDQGLVIWFPGPFSFTGEDCAEMHLHGGRAVVRSVLEELANMPGFRMAEAGEFTRRAFHNGKIDLSAAEGLADLVAAETAQQHRLAMAQAGGRLRETCEAWRRRIISMRALVEAELDFPDEDDIPGAVSDQVWPMARELALEITGYLNDGNAGEIIRDGFEVLLMGPPNAGKSSLLNALARREIAIVTPEAGTTRDLIEVAIDIDGYKVVLVDSAGQRETESIVEREGIRRAVERARAANLVIWLDPDGYPVPDGMNIPATDLVVFTSKDDDGLRGAHGISVRRDGGLTSLIEAIRARLATFSGFVETGVVSRHRHRQALSQAVKLLGNAASAETLALELRAELLRDAGQEIGRIAGVVDVEDLLDAIFAGFCVGK